MNNKKIQQLIQQEKQKRFIVLPYCNSKAEEFADRLKHLVESNFDQIYMTVKFKAPNETGKKFPFKDNIKEIREQSLVVYKIKCQTCNEIYIGKTERIFPLHSPLHSIVHNIVKIKK